MPTVRRRRWCEILLGACLALACVPSPAEPLHTLRFEQLGVEQGLAQDSATAILQDRQGFMWIGSQAGLTRYDGYRFVLFRNKPDDPTSLSDNWVTALQEDGEGRPLDRYPRRRRAALRRVTDNVPAFLAEGAGRPRHR